MGDDYALMADMTSNDDDAKAVRAMDPPVGPNSPASIISKLNSANHQKKGQNVLYVDGRVEFQTTPFCGPPRFASRIPDCIYTIQATEPGLHRLTDPDHPKNPAYDDDPTDEIMLPWYPR